MEAGPHTLQDIAVLEPQPSHSLKRPRTTVMEYGGRLISPGALESTKCSGGSKSFTSRNWNFTRVVQFAQMPTGYTLERSPVPTEAPTKRSAQPRYLALDAYRGFIMLVLVSGG